MSEHTISKTSYFAVYGALLVLLLVTVGAAYIDLGRLNFPVAMAVAITKAVLIILIFMHVRYEEPLVWVFAAAAFGWLAILMALSMSDYFTRNLIAIPGK
jgi:cytochrome c oxidase subunit 4